MPECPPKTDRYRWENRVGKALKDWTTRVMLSKNVTREVAREYILIQIEKMELDDGKN